MNTILCYNSEEDQVHVVERVPNASLAATLAELKPDYAAFVVYETHLPSPVITDLRLIIP